MATYPQTVADNLASLQRQINRINTAQMGPVTVAAGDGSTKMLGPDGGEVFSFDETGMYFLHRGSRRNMSTFSDNVVTWLERNDSTLDAHNTRINTAQAGANQANTRLDGVGIILDIHGDRIRGTESVANGAASEAGRAHSRLDGVGNVLESHNTRIANAGAMAGAAQSRADSAYSRASTGISNAATAQARADSAYSRASTGISNAATAQSRANSAYNLAAGKPSSSEVSSLIATQAARITALAARVQAIENKIQM